MRIRTKQQAHTFHFGDEPKVTVEWEGLIGLIVENCLINLNKFSSSFIFIYVCFDEDAYFK